MKPENYYSFVECQYELKNVIFLGFQINYKLTHCMRVIFLKEYFYFYNGHYKSKLTCKKVKETVDLPSCQAASRPFDEYSCST